MKIKEIVKNFPDIDVRAAITAGETSNGVHEGDFAANLLKSEKREQVAELYLKCLIANQQKHSWAERALYKFVMTWQKPEHTTALSEKTAAACKTILAPFQQAIHQKVAIKQGKLAKKRLFPSSSSSSSETMPRFPSDFRFDQFPSETCTLKMLKAKGAT